MLTYMQNRLLYALIFIVLSSLTSCKSSSAGKYSAPTIPAITLHTGDIAFRMGRTIESRVIAAEGSYSHIGIVVLSNSSPLIVHIEPERDSKEMTKYSTLEEFFAAEHAQTGAIMRSKNIDSLQQEKIKNYLFSLQDISFDHDYALSDSTRMYCTELVWSTYNHIGIDLSRNIRHRVPLAKESVILPNDIYRHPDLQKIWSFKNSDVKR